MTDIVKKPRPRLFYLDFVRAIATIAIVITHYNALYIYLPTPRPDRYIITDKVANIYIGGWGVSLFLIISGAALMYVYREKDRLRLKGKDGFWYKRFLTVYPMFWLAYILAFLYLVSRTMHSPTSGKPIWYLASLFGFDSYLASAGFHTNMIIGEWFIGLIVLLYLLFPLLRYLINKHPVLLGIGAIVVFTSFEIFSSSIHIPLSIIPFVRLPELLFGMYFVKYIKRTNIWMLIVSVLVLVLNTIFHPTFAPNLQTLYVGIASFLILVCLADFIKGKSPVKSLCSLICKYSYSIFLVHHLVIFQMTERFDLSTITFKQNLYLFVATCAVVFAVAYLLQQLHSKLKNILHPHSSTP